MYFETIKRMLQSNDSSTAGISQYNPIQLAILQDLIGQIFATDLDYIVKCPVDLN